MGDTKCYSLGDGDGRHDMLQLHVRLQLVFSDLFIQKITVELDSYRQLILYKNINMFAGSGYFL
jgi:hypothetical protein